VGARVSPYLAFDGRCEEAFRLYERCLGGKITFLMTYADSPMRDQVPADWGGKIMHATLTLGEYTLMGADPPPEQYRRPDGIAVAFEVDTPDEADRALESLAQGGTVLMPSQETFWAHRFGMVVDRFGIPWQVQCGTPM